MTKFQRKHNDCLSVVIQERDRLQLPPLPDLTWVYEQYPTVESHPPNLVAELLDRYCEPRIGQIGHGDLLCLRMAEEANLGMVYIEPSITKPGIELSSLGLIDDSSLRFSSNEINELWVIYANENGAAREPLHRRIFRCIESVWYV